MSRGERAGRGRQEAGRPGATTSWTGSTASRRRPGPPAAGCPTTWSTRRTAVAERAGARLRLSGDHTVVALAGATGSGKSSTFNALTGLELAAIGVRRPTTSWTMACVWGEDGAAELLELARRAAAAPGAARQHARRAAASTSGLDGLVLLDLPDHDSTEVAHHVEVDRLVKLADLLVWVARPAEVRRRRDPRPLPATARHATSDIMLVVLNHIDEVAAGPARRDGRRPRAAARRGRARPGAGDHHVGAARRRHPRAQGGDRPAGQREEGGAGPADGRRRLGRRPAAGGQRRRQAGRPGAGQQARARRRLRGRRRRAHRRPRRRAVHPAARGAGDRLAGDRRG